MNIHRSGVLTALAWLVQLETAAVSAQVLCTPYNHAPCHFVESHLRKVYAYLAVTCHLHFRQNDRDLLRATAVTRGWNGYRSAQSSCFSFKTMRYFNSQMAKYFVVFTSNLTMDLPMASGNSLCEWIRQVLLEHNV